MVRQKWSLLISSVLFATLPLLLRCVIPADPDDPVNTSVKLLLQTSKWKMDNSSIIDTVGNVVRIGATINLPENIDSIALTLTEDGKTVFNTVFRGFISDTVWKEMVFSTEGIKTATFTPYSSLNLTPVTGTIFIIDKRFPINHKPHAYIEGNTTILPSQTCSLTLRLSERIWSGLSHPTRIRRLIRS